MRELLLNWATLAVSFFNTILLLWLGLTVLLNSDRRAWGIWLAGGGLLLGGIFFVSHTAVLGLTLMPGPGMTFWLLAGSIPALLLPYAWYTVMLWYAGFWDDSGSALYRRQRLWFVAVSGVMLLGLFSLLLLPNPLARIYPLSLIRQLILALSVGIIPLPVLAFPLYVVICISLSLDALRNPGPSGRVMGNLARRRAHPWLIAVSLVLLLVSLLVAYVLTWIALTPPERLDSVTYLDMANRIARFDLLTASLIAIVVVLLGQAIVAYEIFTGKTLPRRGLTRHWRLIVLLAAGYSLLVGGSLQLQLRPVHSLLLVTLLMVAFLAFFSWRTFVERERSIDQLRPFVASPRLYDQILTANAAPQEIEIGEPFRALCRDLLETQVAYLAPLGPLASLVGPPLAYPESARLPAVNWPDLLRRFTSPQTICLPVEPGQFGGAAWAIPLWSTRGLIGVFLLGEKRDDALYTQEQIEIARASGERFIDTQASGEMARRLVNLQRQRLAESQVADHQTRRILHDDVLPLLHTAMLSLAPQAGQQDNSEAITLLGDAHRRISDLLHEIPVPATPELTRLGLLGALQRMVANEMSGAFDELTWEFRPEEERLLQAIPPLTAEVLYFAAREAIRNAARHGRDGDHPLYLRVTVRREPALALVIEDNGRGFQEITTSESQPNGRGLALHSTMMAVVGGALTIDSAPRLYTRVILSLLPE